jgi:hypothetical protein
MIIIFTRDDKSFMTRVTHSINLNKGKYVEVKNATDRKLFAYGTDKPLDIVKVFGPGIQFENRKQRTDIMVIEGKCVSLLGKDNATRLGLLKVGPTASVNLVKKYEDCFTCLCKLKVFQLGVDVDLSLYLVIQPFGNSCLVVCVALLKRGSSI